MKRNNYAEVADRLVERLRLFGIAYRSTRKRSAIHDFLEGIYKVYWIIKRSSEFKSFKKALKIRAGLSARKTIPLSSLLLCLASADSDRRDRHRWKCLLEAAYANKVPPNEFNRKVIAQVW